jgi:hypothetical protein
MLTGYEACFDGAASEPLCKWGVLFIALGRKAQAAIEKLIQQAQQFHLAVNFDGTTRGTLTL